MHPVVRFALALVAGLVVVYLVDRFFFPGSFIGGAVGVVAVVAVLVLQKLRST